MKMQKIKINQKSTLTMQGNVIQTSSWANGNPSSVRVWELGIKQVVIPVDLQPLPESWQLQDSLSDKGYLRLHFSLYTLVNINILNLTHDIFKQQDKY